MTVRSVNDWVSRLDQAQEVDPDKLIGALAVYASDDAWDRAIRSCQKEAAK